MLGKVALTAGVALSLVLTSPHTNAVASSGISGFHDALSRRSTTSTGLPPPHLISWEALSAWVCATQGTSVIIGTKASSYDELTRAGSRCFRGAASAIAGQLGANVGCFASNHPRQGAFLLRSPHRLAC